MLAPTSLLGKFVKFYKVSLGKVCEFTPPAPYASKCPVPRYHHGHVDKRPSVLDVKRCQMRGPAANNPQEPRRTPWNCRGKIPFKNNGEKILGTGRFFFWKKSSTTCNLMFFFGWMWMRWEHYSFLLKSFLFFFCGDWFFFDEKVWLMNGRSSTKCMCFWVPTALWVVFYLKETCDLSGFSWAHQLRQDISSMISQIHGTKHRRQEESFWKNERFQDLWT